MNSFCTDLLNFNFLVEFKLEIRYIIITMQKTKEFFNSVNNYSFSSTFIYFGN